MFILYSISAGPSLSATGKMPEEVSSYSDMPSIMMMMFKFLFIQARSDVTVDSGFRNHQLLLSWAL